MTETKIVEQSDNEIQQSDNGKAPPRTCRVCLQSEEEDENDSSSSSSGILLSPCGCIGTNKWVHAQCLNTWRIAVFKRRGDATRCELCQQPYAIKGLAADARKSWVWPPCAQPALLLIVCVFLSFCFPCPDHGLISSLLHILALCALSRAAALCLGDFILLQLANAA